MKIRGLMSVVLVGVMCSAAFADAVRMRASVRLIGDDLVVTLSEIADLSGPEAEALGHLEIARISDPHSLQEIDVRRVRKVLDENGVNWGKVHLSGRTVVLRPRRPSNATPPKPMAAAAIKTAGPSARSAARTADTKDHDERSASDTINLATLRGVVTRMIATGMQIKPGDLRIRFQKGDAVLLDMPQGAAQFEIQPNGSYSSDRLEVVVREWVDGRVAGRHTLTVMPRVRAENAELERDLPRGEVITPSDVQVVESWLPPSQNALLVNPVEAIGAVAARRLDEGAMIRRSDLKQQMVVRRGDQAIVRCVAGSMALTVQAEALDDGAIGDLIEFRKKGERQSFLARVTGPNEAVTSPGG